MAEAARAKATAETMKNPLAKKGMESIAANYEAFARRAELLTRSGYRVAESVTIGTR